ncbi:MAG: MFS transporter [Micrococcales bacterium]|nr:MFS transporter [Micrococcales bacterium]
MAADRTDPAGESRESPFSAAYLVLTVSMLALITVVAFEAIAISTAMPVVARELGAVRSYGLAFSVMLTTQLLGIVLSGVWSDRSGPEPPLIIGITLFAIGSALCGASGSLLLFLAGRAISGLGAGLLVVVLYVIVGRVYPQALQPRVFALNSAAWVLPSLLGPPIAAAITEAVGWRWVFWCVVAPTVVAAVLFVGQRRRVSAHGGPHTSSRDAAAHRRAARLGLAIALAAGALQWGTHELDIAWSAKTVTALAGLLGVIVVAPLLLPRGTWVMGAGLPSVMLSRFLCTAVFFGTTTFVPLMLVQERGLTTRAAGLVLAVGSVGWSAGSWVQGLDTFNGRRSRLVSLAGLGLAAGVGIFAVVSAYGLPWWLIIPGMVIGGLGMGIGTSSVSVLALTLAAPEQHGEASSSLMLADTLGSVLGLAAAGAAFAAWHSAEGDAGLFALIWGAFALVALLLVPAGQRIST